MVVKKTMFGMNVEALPRYRGGCEPDYWVAIIKNRILLRSFDSPGELFSYVEHYLGTRYGKAV